MEAQVVGKIVAITGNATLKINGETIQLSVDSPVFKGATLTTGPDSHIEVRFIDDTMLSQSEKTEISIDNYVYDQPDSAPALLLKLSEGTLRSITGKIAEENPESFQLESPLASIGIRGTDFTFIHDPSTGSRVVLNQISENHILLVNDQYGNIRYLNDPSTFVAVLEDRPISTVEFLSQAERDELLLETPFTTLENNGIEDGDADPDAPPSQDSGGAGGGGGEGADYDQGETSQPDYQEIVDSLHVTPEGSQEVNESRPTQSALEIVQGITEGTDAATFGPLTEELMDSTADQSFDISLLDSLPPTGAGPIDPGLPDSIFTLDLYGAFDSGISAVEPFSTAATGTFLSATSLYNPVSNSWASYDPVSGGSDIYQDPTAPVTGLESTPEIDSVLASAPSTPSSSPTAPQPVGQSPPQPATATPQASSLAATQSAPTQSQPVQNPSPPAPPQNDPPPPPPLPSADLILVAGDGGATLTGGAGNDTLYGGQGVDSFYGGGGNDSFVILGGFGSGVYSGIFPGNIDLAAGSPTYQADAVLDGGSGYDTLINYGTADYNGVSFNSIESIVIFSDVIFTPDQFASISDLTGEGAGPHTVTFTTGTLGAATIDLSTVTINNIDQITVESGITAVVTPEKVDALLLSGNPAPLSGSGTILTSSGVDFSDFVDAYDSAIADSIILGRAPTAILLDNSSIESSAGAGSTVGVISATDPDSGDEHTYSSSSDYFDISGSNVLVTTTYSIPPGIHTVEITATDSSGQSLVSIFDIEVNDQGAVGPISDVDGAAGGTVAENAAINDLVGITAQATDPDPGDSVSYSLSDSAGGLFQIDSGTGVISVANALDFETATSHSVTVLATSSDGSESTQAFTIAVTDINDQGAVGPISDVDGAAGGTVAENAAINDLVGITAQATDPDPGDSVSYSLSDSAGGLFQIDSGTGVISVANALDFETATSHSVTVLATSSDGSESTQAFTIAVTDINDQGAVGPISDVDGAAGGTVAENAAINDLVGITAQATDPDPGDSVSYSLSDSAGGLFQIDSGTGVISVANALDFETATSHSVTVLATSSDGSESTQAFTIAVTDINDQGAVGPISDVDGAAGGTVAENAAINDLVGITAQATDPDPGDSVSYSLSDSAGGLFQIDSGTGVISVANALDFETATSHSVTVLATSSDGSESTQAFTIAVTDINDQGAVGPISDVDGAAGGTVAENAAINDLVGITAQATDPDPGDSVSYSLSDSAGGLFQIDSGTGVISVANALDFETATSHSVTVLATSSDGSESTQAFTIAVTDINDQGAVGPISDVDGAAGGTVAENAAINDLVGITAQATDPDPGDSVSYSLSDSAGGLFQIDSGTGVISVANALDFETATSHSVTVLATSSDGSESTQAFTIAVTDINDQGAVGPISDVDGAAGGTVAENAAINDLVGITAQATDPDPGDSVSYSLSDSAGGLFQIDSGTGVISVANALDFETATSHSVTVLATSSDGSESTQAFTIAVTDINDQGAVGPISDVDGAAGGTVAENAAINDLVGITAQATDPDPGDSVSYSLSDSAGGLFQIDSGTGVISVANALDFETATSHSVTVLATSSDGSESTQAFTIAVTDINDQGAVGPISDVDGAAGGTVAENAAINDLVGITAQATDPDPGDSVSYSLSDSAGGLFQIDSGTGVISVANALDFETATSHSVTVLATSSDGSESTQAFTIAVTDINDQGAVGPISDVDGAAGGTVAENAAINDLVGITAQATDPDPGDSVSYSLSDSAGGLFQIDSGTGVISVANALDFETATSHSVTVLATSSDGSESTQAFTIAVTDINDQGAVGPISDVDGAAGGTVAENAAINDLVGITAQATDPDPGDSVSYSLSDSAGGLFQIDSGTGVISVANALDFETATSHSVTVLATSSDGSESTQAFTIAVTDINDQGAVGPISDVDGAAGGTVAENAAINDLVGITAQATDPDPGDSVSYSLSDSAGGLFQIDSGTGVISVANALDFETATSHSVTVLATSSDGSESTQAFTIAVTDINDQGAVGPISDVDGAAGGTVAENAAINDLVGITAQATDPDPGDSVSYSLSDSAGGLFQIDSGTGVISVANALDFETATSHSVTVLATSSDGSESTQAFTIAVTDINDQGAVGPISDVDGAAGGTVAENAAINDLVGITAQATDPDPGDSVSYSLSDSAGGLFQIDSGTGVISVANALDFETATSHSVTVLATSSDGSESTQAFTIAVTDINDQGAVGPISDVDGAAGGTVAENAAINDLVGITAQATDPDPGDSVSYSLSDSAGGLFQIDSGTGVISVANALDFETATSHDITVRATSSDGSYSDQIYTVQITDVDEFDIGPLTDSDITVNQISEDTMPGTYSWVTAFAEDPDSGDTVLYSITNDPSEAFNIVPDQGWLYLAYSSKLDFETLPTVDVEITATSSDGSTSSKIFTIDILNVDDPRKVGGEFQVNSTTEGGQLRPAITSLPDGGYVVAWASFTSSASTSGIFVQRYDSNGDKHGDEFQISSNALHSQSAYFPSVNSLSGGGYAITWMQISDDNSLEGVYGNIVNENGQLGNEFKISESPSSLIEIPDFFSLKPTITSLEDGGFVVSWSQVISAHENSSTDVFAKIYDAAGNAITSQFQVSSNTDFSQTFGHADALDSNGFVITWTSLGLDGSSEIKGRLFDSSGTPVGDEFSVNTYTDNDQLESRVSVLTDGRFVVTWQSWEQDGSYRGVFGQMFDSDGNSVGDEFQVNTHTAASQRSPSISSLSDGGFVITWDSNVQDGEPDADGLNFGIYGQAFDSNGERIGGEFHVTTYTESYQRNPAVTVLADGSILTVWDSLGQDGSDWGVYGQRFIINKVIEEAPVSISITAADIAENEPVDTPIATFSVLDPDPGDTHSLELQDDFGGTFYISDDTLYSGISFDYEDISSYSLSVRATGIEDGLATEWISFDVSILDVNEPGDASIRKIDGEFQINSYTVGDQFLPTTTTLANGSYVVVWQSSGQDDGFSSGVYGQLYSGSGAAIGHEFQINKYTTDDQNNPVVSALSDGGFVVAYGSEGQDGSDSGVYGQFFDDLGNQLGHGFRLNDYTDSEQGVPAIAALTDGRFVATWQSMGQDGDGYGIYGKVYGADGFQPGTEFQVNTATALDQKDTAVTGLPDGGFIVTWQQAQSADWDAPSDIYGQIFRTGGPASNETTPLGSEFLIGTIDQGEDQREPAVAALANGAIVVVWSGFDSIYNNYLIFGKAYQYDSDSGTIDDPAQFEITTTGDGYWPSIAPLADGGYVVAWDAGSQYEDGSGTFAQVFDANSNRVGGLIQANTFIEGDQLLANVAGLPDGSFVITWQSMGQDGDGSGVFGQRFIVDESGSEAATGVYLSSASIPENAQTGYVIGQINIIDPDLAGTNTLSIYSQSGATFEINENNELVLESIPEYSDPDPPVSVTIIAESEGDTDLSLVKTFDIFVNHSWPSNPVDLYLSSTSVDENLPAETVVGTLSTLDPDSGDVFSYMLLEGPDNWPFEIVDNVLRTTTTLDYELDQTSYDVFISVRDQLGYSYGEKFTIEVNNVQDVVSATDGTFTTVAQMSEDTWSLQTVLLENGDYVVSWYDGYDIAQYGQYASIYDQAGTLLTQTPLYLADTNAQITALTGGGFASVWNGNDEFGQVAYLARTYDNSGAVNSTEDFVVVPNSMFSSEQGYYDPAIGTLQNGNFVVAFSQIGAEVSYAKIFSPDGAIVIDSIPINNDTYILDWIEGINSYPTSADPFSFLIAYSGSFNTSVTQLFSSNGVPLGEEIPTWDYWGNPLTNAAKNNWTVSLDSGHFVQFYTQNYSDTNTFNLEYSVYSPEGNFLEDGVLDSFPDTFSSGGHAPDMSFTSLGGNNIVVAWETGGGTLVSEHFQIDLTAGVFPGPPNQIYLDPVIGDNSADAIVGIITARDPDDTEFNFSIDTGGLGEHPYFYIDGEFLRLKAPLDPTAPLPELNVSIVATDPHDNVSTPQYFTVDIKDTLRPVDDISPVTTVPDAEADITSLSNGNYVVTYTFGGESEFLHAQIFSADSSTLLDSPLAVNSGSGNFLSNASITELDNQSFVVTWVSTDSSDQTVLLGKIYSADGTIMVDEFQVNTDENPGQMDMNSSIAAIDEGFVVVWTNDTPDDVDVYMQIFDNAGNKQNIGEIPVASLTNALGNQLTPDVARLENNDFIVTWTNDLLDGSNTGIYGRIFTSDGAPVTQDAVKLNDVWGYDNPYDYRDAKVTGLSDGGFAIAFTSIDPSYDSVWNSNVYVNQFDVINGEIVYDLATYGFSSSGVFAPSIVQLEDGYAVSAMMVDSYGEENDFNSIAATIVTAVFNETGEQVGYSLQTAPDGLINWYDYPGEYDFSQTSRAPELAYHPGGGFTVVYSFESDTDISQNGIYTQRYIVDSALAESPSFLSLDTTIVSENHQTGIANPIGNFYVIDPDLTSDDNHFIDIVAGDTGNLFDVVDNQLVLNSALDASTTPNHTLTMEVTGDGFVYTQDITITVEPYEPIVTALNTEPLLIYEPGGDRLEFTFSGAEIWDGYTLVTYSTHDSQDPYDSSSVYGQLVDPNGQKSGAPILIAEADPQLNLKGHSDVASLGDLGDESRFIVTWSEFGHDGSNYAQVYGQLYSFNHDDASITADASDPFVVSSDLTANKDWQRVSPLPNGGFVVAFMLNDNGQEAIAVRTFDKTMTPFGDDVLVTDTTGPYMLSTIEAYEINGDPNCFVVTYESDDGVKGQFFNSSGNPIGTSFSVDGAGNDLGTNLWQTVLDSGHMVDLEHSTDGLDYKLFEPGWEDWNQPLDEGDVVTFSSGEWTDFNQVFSIGESDFAVLWNTFSNSPAGPELTMQRFSVDPNAGIEPGPPWDLILHGGSVVEEDYSGQLVGVLSALDPDSSGAELSYSITGGNDNFYIDGNGLYLSGDAGFDYENQPPDGLHLTIEVSDGTSTLSEDFTITIENVIEPGETEWVTSFWPEMDHRVDHSPEDFTVDGRTPVVADLPGSNDNYVLVDVSSDSDLLRARIYQDGSVEVVPAFTIVDHSDGAIKVSAPTATSLPGSDNFMVSWFETDDSGNTDGYFKIYDQSGDEVTNSSVNFTYDSSPTGSPEVAVIEDGVGFAMAWTADDGDGSGIHVRSFDSDGYVQSEGEGGFINLNTAGDQHAPSIAHFDNGDSVIVWQDDSGIDGDGSGIYLRYYDSTTDIMSDQYLVNRTTAGNQVNPSVAVSNGDDSIMVSWTSGNPSDVYASSFKWDPVLAQLDTYTEEFKITDSYYGLNNQGILGTNSPYYLVYWISDYYDDYGIRGQFISSDGTPLAGKFNLNPLISDVDNVSVTFIDTPASVAIAWQGTTREYDIGLPNIYKATLTVLHRTEGDDDGDTIDHSSFEEYTFMLGRGGNDTLFGGPETDFIKGGEGMDAMYGGDGDDTFVIWGSFAAADGNDAYADNPDTLWDESSDVFGDSLLNGNSVSHFVAGEIINGGAGNNQIESYGTVDFSEADANITNIQEFNYHSNVTFTVGQLAEFGITSISGRGDEPHILNFTGEGVVDLSSITIDNVTEINIDPGVEVVLTEEQEATLNIRVVDSPIDNNPVDAEIGDSASAAAEPLFGDSMDSSNLTGNVEPLDAGIAALEPAYSLSSTALFGDNPVEEAGLDIETASAYDAPSETTGQPVFGDDETGSGSADTYLPEPLLADTGEDVSMDVTIEQPLLTVDDLAVEPDTDPALLWLDSQVDDVDTAS